MKKFVVISFILLAILGAAIWETVTISSTYSTIETRASNLIRLIESEGGDISQNEAIVQEADDLTDEWSGFSSFANVYCNHSVVKSVTEKIVMLSAYIKTDNKNDAYATACALRALSGEMKNEALPVIGNLL